MMKKCLVVVALLAMASLASAGHVEWVITSRGPAFDATTPIPPTTEITLLPSEWVDIDIMYTGDVGRYLFGLGVNIAVDESPGGTGSFLDPNGLLTYPPDAWDTQFLEVITEIVPGKSYNIIEGAVMLGVPGTGEPTIALDHILFHCDGEGDVLLAMTDLGTTVEVDGQFNPFPVTFGQPLAVHQIPEPMTVALLGLGTLLLRRRRA